MPQNRNKLIELFIGNISNAIVHDILEKAIKNEKQYLADKYRKELLASFQIARKYREKINLGLSRKEGITPNEAIINKLQPEAILGLFFRLNK